MILERSKIIGKQRKLIFRRDLGDIPQKGVKAWQQVECLTGSRN